MGDESDRQIAGLCCWWPIICLVVLGAVTQVGEAAGVVAGLALTAWLSWWIHHEREDDA